MDNARNVDLPIETQPDQNKLQIKMRSLYQSLQRLCHFESQFATASTSAMRVGLSVYQTGGEVVKISRSSEGEIDLTCRLASGTVNYKCDSKENVQFLPAEN